MITPINASMTVHEVTDEELASASPLYAEVLAKREEEEESRKVVKKRHGLRGIIPMGDSASTS